MTVKVKGCGVLCVKWLCFGVWFEWKGWLSGWLDYKKFNVNLFG